MAAAFVVDEDHVVAFAHPPIRVLQDPSVTPIKWPAARLQVHVVLAPLVLTFSPTWPRRCGCRYWVEVERASGREVASR